MRLEDLFEQPAVALTGQGGVMGTGLDPAQFNSRYGMSPAQANQTVNRIVRLNPQFRTPQFRNAITNFLIDNPKSLQAANQNLRIPANQNVRPTSTPRLNGALGLLRGLASRVALGTIGLILTPSEMGDGTVDPDQAEAWETADAFMRHMSQNNPGAFIELIDAEAAAMDAQELEGGYDPRDSRYYRNAQAAIAAQAAADEYAGGDRAGEFNVSPGPQVQTTSPTPPALPSGDVDLGMDADAQTGTWTPPAVSFEPPQLTPQDLDVDIPNTRNVELPPPPVSVTSTAPSSGQASDGETDSGMDANTQDDQVTRTTVPAPLATPGSGDEAPNIGEPEQGPQVGDAPGQISTPADTSTGSGMDANTRTDPDVNRTTPSGLPGQEIPDNIDIEIPNPGRSPLRVPDYVPGQPRRPNRDPDDDPGKLPNTAPDGRPEFTPPPRPAEPVPDGDPVIQTTPDAGPQTGTLELPGTSTATLPRTATRTGPTSRGGQRGRNRKRFDLPSVSSKQPDFDYVSWDPMATPDPLKLKQYMAKKIYPES